MNAVFIAILLMSATGTLLALCAALLRPVTEHNFNSRWHYRIYILIVLFLLLPVGTMGGGIVGYLQQNTAVSEIPSVPLMIDNILTPDLGTTVLPPQGFDVVAETETQAFTFDSVLTLLPFVWLLGMVCFVLWNTAHFILFRRKVFSTSILVEDAVSLSILDGCMSRMGIRRRLRLYTNDMVETPMLMGLFQTRLLLPEVHMEAKEIAVILRHELTHFRRHDLWIKSLVLLANAVHWFNPIAYWLTKRVNRLCELSCDELVVAEMNQDERQFYGETILNILCRVVNKHSGLYATLAESKKGIEKRLEAMMNVMCMII